MPTPYPSDILRPHVTRVPAPGKGWMAKSTYDDGPVGFGDTPHKALEAFDKAFTSEDGHTDHRTKATPPPCEHLIKVQLV